MTSYGIHWFRRDLRVVGNPALETLRETVEGRVVGVYFVDRGSFAEADFSPNRFAFLLKTLAALREELLEAGSDLLVVDVPPIQGFRDIFSAIKRSGKALPQAVSYNRDYEPRARLQDEAVDQELSRDFQIQVIRKRDHLLIEPDELVKPGRGESYYQVFRPFANRWRKLLLTPSVRARVGKQASALPVLRERDRRRKLVPGFQLVWTRVVPGKLLPEDRLGKLLDWSKPRVSIPLPEAGSLAAFRRLERFSDRLEDYARDRDYPGLDGTSGLSIYLKNGSLTVAQILAALGLPGRSGSRRAGAEKFLDELIWREFFYHILFHCPRVAREAFRERFKNIRWENDREQFEAWKEGRTGYPFIDAGMRQLNETGWMHNRARMVVASFLVKHLLIDWRWGEGYFMHTLLDGDLASNNGGWQWAASTGCDAQPYFRVFNPVLQSRKYDPHGEYIRRYVPELRSLSDREIHLPRQRSGSVEYPPPIVDHVMARMRVLRRYAG